MRLALLLVLVSTATADVEIDAFYHRLIKFDRRYETMIRVLCGWPEKLDTLEPVCRPAEGHFDVKAYRDAREAAKELFGLVEVK